MQRKTNTYVHRNTSWSMINEGNMVFYVLIFEIGQTIFKKKLCINSQS